MLSNHEPNRDSQRAVQSPDPMDFVETGTTDPDSRRELATYPEHPLFPLEDGQAETRDIHFVTFRRRRSDGRIDNCPEDVPAKDVSSWSEVIGPWGGGEYKAIGKDKNHRIVAWYPPEKGSWLLFDQPSKPFTLRDETVYGRGVDAPAPRPAAPAAAAPSQTDPMMLAMFNQAAETNRTILAAALSSNKESNTWELVRALKEMQPNPLDWLRAVREMLPAPAAAPPPTAQLSLPEQLDTVKTILDWTRPAPAMPEPSALGEIGSLVTTLIQTDAAARAATKSPDPPERRPPPPPRNPRLVHVPGVGLVDVLQPEPALPPGLPAPAAMAAPYAAAPVAQPRTSVGHLDSPSPAPAGIVVAPSAARTPRDSMDTRDPGREPVTPPDAAPAPSDPVGDLVESLRRDPAALGKVLRALGVPPPAMGAEVAAPPPVTQARTATPPPVTHARLAATDVDVGDPRAVAAPPVPSAPSAEPASPLGTLRPRLVRDDEAPTPAAPTPVCEAPPAPTPPAVAGVRKPAPPHGETQAPRRASDVGSLGSHASSERVPSPVVQTRVESSKEAARADHAEGPSTSPASATAHAPPPQTPSTPQRVIELPAQMPRPADGDVTPTRQDDSPVAPGAELTAAEREQAASTLASLPRDKLVAYLKKIPGLAPQADDLVRALGDLPPEAIPILVGHLPPEHARALGAMLKNGKER